MNFLLIFFVTENIRIFEFNVYSFLQRLASFLFTICSFALLLLEKVHA